MTFCFLHAADVHLGFEQYGLNARYNDFARAFEHLVDDAIARRVDAVLLAGDLFHKRMIQPQTLLQATIMLGRLREAGIRVLAIEGNHDRAYHQERLSWLDFLAVAGYWTLLSPAYADGDMVLDPWTEGVREGAYIDLVKGTESVRIIGVPYHGSTTPRVVADLVRALERADGPRPRYTMLMLHAGLQGVLDGYAGTLNRAQLDALRPHVDYVALGHIHKPFVQDDWIYNPGSLETNNTEEAKWPERGYCFVHVDPGADPPHRVEHVEGRRRPFISFTFKVDLYQTPEELAKGLERALAAEAPRTRGAQAPVPEEEQPVVELRLTGTLAFSRSELDVPRLQELVKAAYGALFCHVHDLTASAGFEIPDVEGLDRDELERLVLRELVEREERRRPAAEEWTALVRRLKALVLSGAAPPEIIAELKAFRAELAEREDKEDGAGDAGREDTGRADTGRADTGREDTGEESASC